MTFDMSEAWREATVMIKANREVLTIIAGIFVFLPGVLTGFALPQMNAVFGDPEAMQAQVLDFYSDWGWALLLLILLQVAGYLAMLALLRDRSRPTVGQAIGAGLKGLLPAIGAYLLFLVAMIAAVLVLILVVALLAVVVGEAGSTIIGIVLAMALMVFFFYALVKLSLWAPVIAVEKVHNPLAVLRRSWRMTKGNSLRLLVFYLLLTVVFLVISIVLGMLLSALALVLGESAGVIVSALLNGLIGAVAAVIYVAVLAAIHRQLSSPWAAPVERGNEEPLD